MSALGELKQIRTQHLHEAPKHHRSRWGNLKELGQSMLACGVIENLVVRDRKEGGYEIVAGTRRYRAAMLVDLKTLPCLVRDLDDAAALIVQAEENLRREDIHPMDEAEIIGDLVDLGFDLGDIAKRFSLKVPQVKRRAKLLALTAKARRAFIDAKLDTDGVPNEATALAIARMPAAKQTDILAAIEAGSLMPEEIESYVDREFTRPLEDLPWRVTDSDLVKSAGPCSGCPKRTDVQKDLFVDVRAGVHCMDVDCYRGKMDASYAIALSVVSQSPEGLAQVHDASASNLFIPMAGARPKLMKNTGFIDADATCPHLVGHTWREAIAKASPTEPPAEYLARDQDGRPRYMFRETIAQRVVKKSEAVAKQVEETVAADPVRPDAPATNTRAEAKIRRAVVDQLIERITSDNEVDAFSWIVERVIDNASSRSQSKAVSQFADEIKAMSAEGLDGLRKLASESNRRAKQVAMTIMVYEEADVVGEFTPAIDSLAKLYELDLIAIENDIRKDA